MAVSTGSTLLLRLGCRAERFIRRSRLERDGYLRSAWEEESAAYNEGRPARRYYRLTAPGVKALAEVVAFYQALLPARSKPARG